MPDDGRDQELGNIPTNLRLLRVLEEVARAGVPVIPADVGTTLDLPKPTVHRLFHTAEAQGFLQRDIDGKSYGPGKRLRRLAVNTLSSLRLRIARAAILKSLADEIGETCNIAIPDRERMIYLDRIETKWPLRIQLPIGTQVPFHCTASGKMYLSSLKSTYLERFLTASSLEKNTAKTLTEFDELKAELLRTRRQGYSTDDEEFMEGMVAVAVPIYDTQKRVLATLSVHAPIQRHALEDLVEFLPLLSRSSEELAALLTD